MFTNTVQEAANNEELEPILEQLSQNPMETDPPLVVPGPVKVNNGEIVTNIVDNRVTNSDDEWSFVVSLAKIFFLLISPWINYFSVNNEYERLFSQINALIKLGQKFIAIIAFLLILYYDYMIIHNVINETKPYGREFWINLHILTMSVTVLATMYILWARHNNLRKLVLSYEEPQLSPINIDMRTGKIRTVIKTVMLYLFIIGYHVVNMFTNDHNLYVATVYSFCVYIGYNNIFIFYIVLCWMMCARFRHLNFSVKSLTDKISNGQDGIRADKQHLQLIADWYVEMFTRSICIETMLDLNDLSCSLGTK
jgi:hypothetical protein